MTMCFPSMAPRQEISVSSETHQPHASTPQGFEASVERYKGHVSFMLIVLISPSLLLLSVPLFLCIQLLLDNYLHLWYGCEH